MKKLKLLTIAAFTLISSNTQAHIIEKPAGFVPVSFKNYKSNDDGVFLFCDAPTITSSECRDILIRGSGNISTEYKRSKWRTADQYVKYKINKNTEFMDFQITTSGIFLVYKKIN